MGFPFLPLAQAASDDSGNEVEQAADAAFDFAVMAKEWLMTDGIELGKALLVLLVGLWVVGRVVAFARGAMERSKLDKSLHAFLCNLLSWTLKIVLVIAVLGMVGVELVGLAAILAGASLAVGLALQGSLGNLAGGVLILIFRPFRVGDVVDAQGFVGKVHEIQVFCTVLKTPDNKTIILPNGPLSNGSVVNLTVEETRRVDWTIGVGYDDDLDKARSVILGVLSEDKRIHAEPAAVALVANLGASSVDFSVRAWAATADYWDVFMENQEKIKKALDANGVSIPYPQRDVHLYDHGKVEG